MIRAAVALIAVFAVGAGVAHADDEADADRAFQAASQRAVSGDPGAIDAFEALGVKRPETRWTDDAWVEAARIAERAGDLARARRDLAQAIEVGSDELLVRRARVALARLTAETGGGQWDRVQVEHERLVSEIRGGGDPRAALEKLEALVRANPTYPNAGVARVVIAKGWEEEGHRERGLDGLRAAAAIAGSDPRQRTRLELARMLTRNGDLVEASRVADEIGRVPGHDQTALAELIAAIERADRRAAARRWLWLALAILAVAAVISLRRATGSWKAGARRIVRPPTEVMFLAPIAALLIVVAWFGNPLVARAVTGIVVSGVVVAWVSGATLDAVRARGSVGLTRMLVQGALALGAVAATAYLAIDGDHVLDLLRETWRGGHALD